MGQRQKYSYSPNLNIGMTTSLAQQKLANLVRGADEEDLQRSENIKYASIAAKNVWTFYTQNQEKEVTRLLSLEDPEGVPLFKYDPKYGEMNLIDKSLSPAGERLIINPKADLEAAGYTADDLLKMEGAQDLGALVKESTASAWDSIKTQASNIKGLWEKGVAKTVGKSVPIVDKEGVFHKSDPFGEAPSWATILTAGQSIYDVYNLRDDPKAQGEAALKGIGKTALAAWAPGLGTAWALYDLIKSHNR